MLLSLQQSQGNAVWLNLTCSNVMKPSRVDQSSESLLLSSVFFFSISRDDFMRSSVITNVFFSS